MNELNFLTPDQQVAVLTYIVEHAKRDIEQGNIEFARNTLMYTQSKYLKHKIEDDFLHASIKKLNYQITPPVICQKTL